MKKALKITGITLASLVGLILIVAVVASLLVTSSGWLTKQVKKYAPQFVNCEIQLGKADLKLFKTFPNVGIDIENVALINSMEGSPSDTLANIDNLTVALDIKKLLKEKEIVIKKCILEDALVNLYTDTLGQNNFDVFNSKEKDTVSSSFDYLVDIEEVKLKNTNALYTDARNGMKARAQGLDLDLNGNFKEKDIEADLDMRSRSLNFEKDSIRLAVNGLNLDFKGDVTQMDRIAGTLNLATPDICLNLKEDYLDHDTLSLNLPLQFSLKEKKGHLEKAQIGLNQYLINVDGDAALADNGDINLDLALNTSTLVIEDVLTYLPQNLQKSLSSVEYRGKLNITEAQVVGTVNDSLMPVITAKVTTDEATVNVPSLPYPFSKIDLDGLLTLNLNEKQGEFVVNGLNANFNQSSLNAKGTVKDLLGDLGFKFNVTGDVPMTDLKPFLPKNIKLAGRTDLNLNTDCTLDQLMKSLKDYNLNRLFAQANLKVKGFAFDMDTIHVTAPVLNANVTLPASAKERGKKGAYVALSSSQMQAKMGKTLDADMKNPDIKLSADNFKGGIEKMLLDGALKFSHLDVVYDTITAHLNTPNITIATTPNKSVKGLKARITLDDKDIVANMGKVYALNSNALKVDASVNENKNKNDFLNHWNPSADFMLSNATLKVADFDEDIRINNIDFLFNSSELDFKKSTLRIGQSDFSLQGSVVGIKEWIEDHKNLMKGEMQLSSNHLDLNEIMDLTNGLGRSDTEPAESKENKEDDPFMVPEGIDFSFILNTKRAITGNFDLNNLKGTATVKDGTLILQEIGFTNKAAEMQLTAMYQSPRKNNLFLAMDFHLLNVQINDLLHMIPYIDTLVPVLKTFDGQAEFHIGAETNLRSNYQPKISTLRAAADIEGKNLTVNDKFTFTKITDMLDVSTNGEYRVDSLDVQLTAFKNEIDLWPSQIAIGKYKVTVDGRETLDQNAEYHLSVTQSPLPVRLGLKISGPFDNLKYEIESCKYPNLYKPNKRNDTEQMYFELKKKIADRLKANVR